MKKIVAFILGLICIFSFVACSNKGGDNFTYTRESTDDMLKFSSSDSGLNDFLNDYLHRHLRYDDQRIDFRDLGGSVTFGKEWEAYSLMFFDSTENVLGNSRQNMLKTFIENVPVDRFGYVWNAQHSVQENDVSGETYFHQGWPFPAYATVNNSRARGWEFANGQKGGWTTTLNGADYDAKVEVNSSFDGKLVVESNSINKIEFISPENTNIDCSWAPFLEFDIRITDTSSSDVKKSFIEDLEVYWKHSDEDWSDGRKVTYSDFATTGDMTITPNFNRHIYFPMYLHNEWGKSADNRVMQYKLVVKTVHDGKAHKGNVKLNFVRAQFDTRQTNNIGIFLSTAKKYLEFTGDRDVLSRNLARLRMATQFLIGYCNGGANGLIDRTGFVGHEGSKGEAGTSIGNGYWDMLSTPSVSLYANLFYYRTVESMLYIERMAKAMGIEQELPTVWNKNATAQTSYPEYMSIEGLQSLLTKIKSKIQEPIDTVAKKGFWDTQKGRFIEGFDSDGDVVDYGYVMYNLEAIASGVTTDEQADEILKWVNGDRIVEEDKIGDEQSYATGKKGSAVASDGYIETSGTLGIYDYEFAPRVSTVKNYEHYYWKWDGLTPAYSDQLQDGGATMYVSYYDIMSRIATRGADDAFTRLKEIQKWYEKVKKAADKAHEEDPEGGYNGRNFYHAYYNELGISLQGNNNDNEGNGAGTLGLAYEFLESALLYATVPYGFFGISSQNGGTLSLSPEMPSSLSWWKMENLLYCGVHYDMTIGKDFVQIDYVRGNTQGLNITVSLPGTSKSAIYLNGTAQKSEYDALTGKVSATIPFRACNVTVK